MTTTPSHSRLSPSARSRWSVCPASVRASEGLPPEPSGAASIDGTHTHTLLEQCVNMMLMPADAFIGQTMTDHEGSFVVDADRAERVQVALNYIQARMALFARATVHAEVKVDPAPVTGRDDLSGTVDVHIITTGTDGSVGVEIIDYKDGVQRVPAKNNPQLEQYAIGLMCRYPKLPFKRVTMTIVQPKLRALGLDPISAWEVDVADFYGPTRDAIVAQAKATDDPNAPFVAGDHCKWCRVKGCTAKTTQTLAKAGIAFPGVGDATANVVDQAASLMTPDVMSDAQLLDIVRAAPMIRAMLDSVETHVRDRFAAGKPVPGLRMVTTPGKRNWALPDDEIAAKLIKMGVPKAMLYKKALISFTAVEKGLSWVKRDGTPAALAKNQIERVMNDYVAKGPGSVKVVLEDSLEAKDRATDVAKLFNPV